MGIIIILETSYAGLLIKQKTHGRRRLSPMQQQDQHKKKTANFGMAAKKNAIQEILRKKRKQKRQQWE